MYPEIDLVITVFLAEFDDVLITIACDIEV